MSIAAIEIQPTRRLASCIEDV